MFTLAVGSQSMNSVWVTPAALNADATVLYCGRCQDLHQEINKHLTLRASMNQVVSYWLLPFVMETAVHEDQGMICNTVGSAVASKTLTALNTAKLLIEMHIVSD